MMLGNVFVTIKLLVTVSAAAASDSLVARTRTVRLSRRLDSRNDGRACSSTSRRIFEGRGADSTRYLPLEDSTRSDIHTHGGRGGLSMFSLKKFPRDERAPGFRTGRSRHEISRGTSSSSRLARFVRQRGIDRERYVDGGANSRFESQ